MHIFTLLLRPWVISGLAAAFGASLFWMAAMTKFELSKAYPFMALNFVLVGLIAVPLFGEVVSPAKITGMLLVVAGLVVLSQG
jgi:multidrug transporter EmrE-like cation transporter